MCRYVTLEVYRSIKVQVCRVGVQGFAGFRRSFTVAWDQKRLAVWPAVSNKPMFRKSGAGASVALFVHPILQ